MFSGTDLSKQYPDVWVCSELVYAPGSKPVGSWRVIRSLRTVLRLLDL